MSKRDWMTSHNYYDFPMVFGTETEFGALSGNNSLGYGEKIFPLLVATIGKKTGAFMRNPYVPWERDNLNHLDLKSVGMISKAIMTGDQSYISSELREFMRGLSPQDYYLSEIGIFLRNGSRLYIDGAHLESSIAECCDPYDVVCLEKAMERHIVSVLPELSENLGIKVRFFKDNTDRKGQSYACHENFLLYKEFFDELYKNSAWQKAWISFLTTSLIYTGAGKVGYECDTEPCDYQISQRADHFTTIVGHDTMGNRPLVNYRGEPLADETKYGRFHVILSDSNMSEWSSYLKVGTKALVLNMLQYLFFGDYDANDLQNFFGDVFINDPVEMVKKISRDLTCKKPLVPGKEKSSPLAIQKFWYLTAKDFYRTRHVYYSAEWIDSLIGKWGQTLEWLEDDDPNLDTTLDWRIKRCFINNYRRRRLQKGEEVSCRDKRVVSLDINYHDIGPNGYYNQLLSGGNITRIVNDDDIEIAKNNPPQQTRAWTRGQFIKYWLEYLLDVQWEFIIFKLKIGNFESICKVELDPLKSSEAFWEHIIESEGNYEEFCRHFLRDYLFKKHAF